MRFTVAKVAALAALAAVATLAALASCSNDDTLAASADGGGGGDSSLGPLQTVGAACNVALTNACVASTNGCSAVACLAGVCTVTPLAENPSCADVSLPMTNTVCDSGAACASGVCGFLAGAGCTVIGVCVTPVDASAMLPPACGCDGLPDPYVAVGFTASPASSPVACVDAAGAEAGDDAGDGGEDAAPPGDDAASDASTGTDASTDASDAASE